jgi:hypothetical protein
MIFFCHFPVINVHYDSPEHPHFDDNRNNFLELSKYPLIDPEYHTYKNDTDTPVA